MMAQPPDEIRDALPAAAQTGEVLGALQTAGERALWAGVDDWWRAPIWWVVTERHAWLVAARNGRAWAVGFGDPELIDLALGWVRDDLRIGAYAIPLRRGTRTAAQALMGEWQKARWGGAPWPPPTERPAERSPAARGAWELPAWWVDEVPGSATDPWLAALDTGRKHPFSLHDGSIEIAPLWIGVGAHALVLAARSSEGALHVEPVPEPFEVELSAPGVLRGVAAGGRRWAEAAQIALEEGSPRRALALIAQATEVGEGDHVYACLGRVLLGIDRADLASRALARHLDTTPDADVRGGPTRWRISAKGRTRALRREQVDEATIRALAGRLLDDLPPLDRSDTLPWPPRGETEVWVAALAHHDRWADATALLERLPHDPRGETVRAEILEAADRPEAADAWLVAARATREAAHAGDASALVARSIARADTPEARWLAAAWAWLDEDAVEARKHWRRALALDPAGAGATRPALPLDGERALATLAEEAGLAEASIAAWTRVRDLDPSDRASWDALARVTEGLGRDPAAAAAVWVRALETLDDATRASDDPPPWKMWTEVARLRALAADHDGALDALVRAIAADFLRAEAYLGALETPGVAIPDVLASWWRHLARLVGGSAHPEGAPMPPRTLLDEATFDALHPGGSGWLEHLRTTLDLPEPPPRSVIVRGLERIADDAFPEVADALGTVAARLGLPDPPATYLYRGDGAWGASAWPVEPPAVLLGYDHLRDGDRHLDPTGLAFLLGVELTHLRCAHPVLAFDRDLLGTSHSVYTAFGRYAGTAETVVDVVTLIPGIDQIAKLQTLLKVSQRVFKTRSAVDKVSGLASQAWTRAKNAVPGLDGLGREGLRGAALQFRFQADRAAFLITGDVRAAVDAILKASTDASEVAAEARDQGIETLLGGADPSTRRLPPEPALRITMLVEFAARQRPDVESP